MPAWHDRHPDIGCLRAYAGPCRLVDGGSLAASGINATGAAAVLNIGHWFTFAGVVAGSVRYVQFRYLDAAGGPAGYNFTNALDLKVCP